MKRSIFCIITMLAITSIILAQNNQYQIITENGKQYYLYTVQKSEGFYSIGKRFEITNDEIIKANPEAALGLKLGQVLKIPVYKSESESESISKPSTSVEPTETNLENQDNENKNTIVDEPSQTVLKYNRTKKSSIRIAILMPFSLDAVERDANMDHFVEFYQGCLIAVDSLKSLGIDVFIDSYDIGKTTNKLDLILHQAALKQADLLIGPAYSSQVPHIADFAKINKIKVVVPFTTNIPDLENNQYLFQIVSPQKELYNKIADKCANQWKNKQVLIVRPDSAGIRYDKKDFVKILIPKLRAKNISVKYISETRIAANIDSAAKSNMRETVVVIPTSNKVKLIQLSEHFSRIESNNVSLFGFPEWHNYQIKDLYVKPLYTFSNYNTDFSSTKVISFYQKYNEKFGIPGVQNSPSYTIFGYDICNYFISQWIENGEHFENFLNDEETPLLQMKFLFERVGNGGYLNRGTIFQLYNDEGILDIE